MLRRWLKILIPFFILPLLWQYAMHYKWAQNLENLTLNFRYWLRGNLDEATIEQKTNKKLPHIIYVNADNASINFMGEAPIPLSFYAKAIFALTNLAKPKVLISDISFFEKQYSSLVDLNRVQHDENVCRHYFERSPNVILGAWYNTYGDAQKIFFQNEHPLPLLYLGFNNFSLIKNPIYPSINITGKNPHVGIVNCDISADEGQTTRWVPLYTRTKDHIYYALGLEALIHTLDVQHDLIDIYGDDSEDEKYENKFIIIFLRSDGQIIKKIPLYKRQLMEINWFSSWSSTKDTKVSLMNVLKNYDILQSSNASKEEKAGAADFFAQFNDAVICLGDSYESSSSLIKTPVDTQAVPSITAHANLLKTMASECYITRLSWGTEFMIVFLLNFFVASLTLYSDFFRRLGNLLVCLVVFYFVLTLYLFGVFNPTIHLALPVVAPLGCILTFLIFGTLYQMVIERKQRLRIKHIFGTYLSPEIVTDMLENQKDPQLGGVEKNITAFFSDIQNFSTFSELLPPKTLVRLMNEYLTAVTKIIKEEGGTLDKYIGDAVVAMFGAPYDLNNHPLQACIAACRIQEKQEWLRNKWREDRDITWPREILSMRTRIGLNSGLATVGNMGSSTRFNFTMMGDTVNVAARCESGAKTFGVYTLVAEDTYKTIVTDSDLIVFRFIDRIVVKGRQHPLGVYELVGMKQQLKSSTFECIDVFEKGIQKYLQQDWIGAIKLFEASSLLEPLQPGRDPGVFLNPSMLYKQRCAYMQMNPPKNWDGVFVMHTK